MIRTKNKTIYIDDKCFSRCGTKYTIPKCICYDVNDIKRTPNRYVVKCNLESVLLNDHIISISKLNKITHLYWNSEIIIIDIPITIQYIQHTSSKNIILYLPKDMNLKYLILSSKFNFPVANLPKKILFLHFGMSFNQDVSNLPFGLQKIWFGYNFNQPVDMLPETLIFIEFSSQYNKNILNLPKSIQTIKLNKIYSKQQDKIETIKLFESKIVWK